jgi:hypothetical protein
VSVSVRVCECVGVRYCTCGFEFEFECECECECAYPILTTVLPQEFKWLCESGYRAMGNIFHPSRSVLTA